MRKIIFLDYLSRSGSTLIASSIHRLADVTVTIEPRFLMDYKPDKLLIRNDKGLIEYLNFLYSQKKFLNWGIDRDELFDQFKKNGFPLNFKMVLHTILDLAYPENRQWIFVIKGGEYPTLKIEHYLKVFNDLKIIFINRDPRAIYNSQKKSLDSQTGQPLAGNILRFVKDFKIIQQKINDPKYKKHMQVISYEDFLHNEDLVLKEICDFIGVPHFIDDRKQYFLSIPDSQKYLHQNVKSGGKLPEREIAWKQEMSDEEKFIITLFLKRELII